MKKKYILLVIGVIFAGLLASALFAQTADDLYNSAVNKYFLGDNEGALDLLNQALELEPTHAKAKALLEEIQKEAQPPAPKVAPAPAPAPLPAPTPTVPEVKPFDEKKAELKAKIDIAHRFFLEGEGYFIAGDYLKARDLFLRVQELLPGHLRSRRYLESISEKLALATPEAAARAAAAPFSTRLFLIGLFYFGLFLAGLLAVVYSTRFIFWFWSLYYLRCPECKTTNPKDAEFCKKCGTRLKLPDLTSEQKVWFSKFGWLKNPFTLTIIPDVFTGHEAEIATINEKLSSLSGHILVIGGLGTGKSTLLQWMEKNIKNKFETIYIPRPPTRPDDLIDLVSATLTKKTTHTRHYSVYDFQNLCKNYKRNILLLLDEAHEFKEEFEQFLRTLGDLPNVFLLMAGLPQAREKLKRDLPALFDRIVESILLGSLTLKETEDLLLKRIIYVGGKGLGPFSPMAIERVYNLSYGIPRGILKICDWVISRAMRANKTVIDVEDINAYSRQIEVAKLVEPVSAEKT